MGVSKKNQNTPGPSEHPPVMGSKVSFMYRCRRNPGKLYKTFSLDDLRAFGINADRWTTAAQDEGEWRRTAEQGAKHFMAKWILCRESQGWTTVCSGMPERDGKDQGEDSPKQQGSC